MRLTRTHLDYWAQGHTPAWGLRVKPVPRVSVHACINAHVHGYPDKGFPRHAVDLETGNLLAILQTIRKRQPMLIELRRMACASYNSAKRRALCRKWARRIETEALKFAK